MEKPWVLLPAAFNESTPEEFGVVPISFSETRRRSAFRWVNVLKMCPCEGPNTDEKSLG
jgi:hypothetical protein